MAQSQWYKEMAVYQIWIRSFCDGNGDGIGDLWGVLSKLDYIKSLGVDAIWFSPIYPSPNADFGYDISDYKNIHPDYGDLDLFRKLLEEAHARGLRVFMDLDMFLSRGYENTSVDEIIAEAQIAKGTYYYYFPSKEKMLEDVIEMMIESEAETAGQIIGSDIPVPQKIAGIIASIKPDDKEKTISDALFKPENVLLHDKIRKKLVEVMVPLLAEVVEEGIKEGIFACDNIPERVRMLLVVSDDTFNDRSFTERDIAVFIDMTEKLLGAEKGTMSFVYDLIDKSEMEVLK